MKDKSQAEWERGYDSYGHTNIPEGMSDSFWMGYEKADEKAKESKFVRNTLDEGGIIMGDWYNVVWLAGEAYIEGSSEKTKWQTIARKLTLEELGLFEEFEEKQSKERGEFLAKML